MHLARKTPLSYGNRPGTNRKARPRWEPADCYNKDSFGRAVKRGIAKANKEMLKPAFVGNWHPNQLRHTRATEVRRQFGLEAVQVVLGHATADVSQIYAERDFSKASDVMRMIG